MPTPDFYLKKGDTASTISSVLRDDNGSPVDIQGAIIYFRMAPISGSGTPALNVTASNDQNGDGTDGTMGKVSYTWQEGDTGAAGLFLAEWMVDWAAAGNQHFPNSGYVLVQISEVVL